jgi:hypothetical protein
MRPSPLEAPGGGEGENGEEDQREEKNHDEWLYGPQHRLLQPTNQPTRAVLATAIFDAQLAAAPAHCSILVEW